MPPTAIGATGPATSSARESWRSCGRRSTPIFTLTGGKDAPHPNATKLYLTWFLAREQQSRLGSFSSRVNVPNASSRRGSLADLRKRFEGYAGLPANKGGVRLAR